MKCTKCNYNSMPEGASFCPHCGEKVTKPSKASTQIKVTQEIGKVGGGKVTGVQVGQVTGPLTVDSTVNHIENKIIQGDYVDRKVILNLLVDDPHSVDEFIKKFTATLGVDKQTLQTLGALNVPEHVGRQITEVVAAQKEVASKGVPITPSAAYRLGMLAAYNRDYDSALAYFRQATRVDPDDSEAFEAISWLQQSRAMDDLNAQNYTAAMEKLNDARSAAMHTDPLDPNALSQRGYVAKTLAQVSEALNDQGNREKYYDEASKLFQHVIQLEPNNAGAHNGLGNIEHALGNIDAAIRAYQRATDLLPNYTAAHHDL